jgi:hypothetical protein
LEFSNLAWLTAAGVRINRDYELMNAAVLTAVLGPILVSLDRRPDEVVGRPGVAHRFPANGWRVDD